VDYRRRRWPFRLADAQPGFIVQEFQCITDDGPPVVLVVPPAAAGLADGRRPAHPGVAVGFAVVVGRRAEFARRNPLPIVVHVFDDARRCSPLWQWSYTLERPRIVTAAVHRSVGRFACHPDLKTPLHEAIAEHRRDQTIRAALKEALSDSYPDSTQIAACCFRSTAG
jgi:hypothetical protein